MRLKTAGSADADIVAVALEGDSSGLVVEVGNPVAAKTKNSRLVTDRVTREPVSAASYMSYVKRYEYSPAPVAAAGTRQNDSSSSPGWKGAARVRWPNSNGSFGICSSGFGVTLSGFEYKITAAHCRGDNQDTQDGAGDPMGRTTNYTPQNDYEWIKVSNSSNRVYVGAYNTTTGSYRSVVGTVGSTKGSYTCQTGASTGTNCDTKIINENYYYKINGYNQWGVRAERQSNARAIGKGDSGGAVIKNTSNVSNVKAAGIISAGKYEVACGANSSNTTCFKQVIYKRIDTVRDNGTVITS